LIEKSGVDTTGLEGRRRWGQQRKMHQWTNVKPWQISINILYLKTCIVLLSKLINNLNICFQSKATSNETIIYAQTIEPQKVDEQEIYGP